MAFLGPNLSALKNIDDRARKGDRVAWWFMLFITIGWALLLCANIYSIIIHW